MNKARSPERIIRARAGGMGFDLCRFTSVEGGWIAGERLFEFVAADRHGTMDWMKETAKRRSHPRQMWPEARSAVVVGMNYGPDVDPRQAQANRSAGAISVYAQGDDYHQLLKGRLKELAGWMKAKFGGEVKAFVDTAPLMEKPLAAAAGLGWQGKHTNLLSREFGSWLFLGVILTELRLAPDAPETGTCGGCTACLDACPTGAFPAPYQIDARRCLSYLTIEHAGPWPEEFRVASGNRIYGCDDCLSACPWNKFAETARETRLHARQELRSPPLSQLLALDEPAFRQLFRKSAVKRIGRERFLRNVLYAAGNSGDPSLLPQVAALQADADPVVADAAAWATARLQAAGSVTARTSTPAV